MTSDQIEILRVQVHNLFQEGLAAEQSEDFVNATLHYTKIMILVPNSPKILARLLHVLEQQDRTVEAEQHLDIYLKDYSADVSLQVIAARILLKNGNLNAAKPCLATAIDLALGTENPCAVLIDILSANRDLAASSIDLLENHQANGQNHEIHGILGQICFDLEMPEKSIQQLDKAIEIEPNNLALRHLIGKVVDDANYSRNTVKKIVGLNEPSDWQMFRWNLSEISEPWFQTLETAPSATNLNFEQKKIAIFALYPWWTSMAVANAVILLWLGHSVDIIWLPNVGRVLPENAWERNIFKTEMEALTSANQNPNLKIIELENFEPTQLSPDQYRSIEAQSLVDTKINIRTPYVNLADPETALTFEHRQQRNTQAAELMNTYLQSHHYDTWILHNGGSLEFGAVFPIIAETGARLACIDYPSRPERIVLSINKPFLLRDQEEAWRQEAPYQLTPEHRTRINAWKEAVETESYYQKNRINTFQTTGKLAPKDIRSKLGLDEERPILLLLPNISWDTTLLFDGPHTIFPEMREWIVKTVGHFIEHPEVQLIIRPHPAEYSHRSVDTTERTIKSKWAKLPEHIHLIETGDDLNTYGLIDIADLGLVYLSDTGWEMPMRGIPVITAGRGHYTGKKFTNDPTDMDNYFELLEKFIDDPSSLAVTKQQIELAYCYANFYLHSINKPSPWRPGSVWHDQARWSMKDMLSAKGMEQYGEPFNIMTGDIQTYNGIAGKPYSNHSTSGKHT